MRAVEEVQKIGRYELLKELGRGNMGIVYLAYDPYIDRRVALKITSPQEDSPEGTPVRFGREFFQEARAAGQLIHPNIVAVYDADVHGDSCYIVMEYVDGQDLREFCHGDSLLPVERVLDMIFNISRGLDHAHNKNIVHRDIKPANIMITSDGVAKIGDFGIACAAHGSMASDSSGTLYYMAPEQIAQEAVDSRSDIFSLGCVLYELLSGNKAFSGHNTSVIINTILSAAPVSLLEYRPDLPEEIDAIVRKALAKKPEERYQTCLDFAYDLKVALHHFQAQNNSSKTDNILDFACTMPFFKYFSREQVANLMAASSTVKCRSGDVIVKEGETDDTLYVILSGSVSVFKKDRKIADIAQGECFGEMAYLSQQPRNSTVIANTDCLLLKISSTLMSRQPEAVQLLFMKSFAITLSGRLANDNRIISYFMRRAQPNL